MPWMSATELNVAGIDCTALRLSFVGELGWELHCAASDLVDLYDAIAQTGEPHGLVDFGSRALNSMRLEKAYHGWGSDFGTEYTLFDAGLQTFAALDKPDFVGREAVLKQCDSSPAWRFVRLLVDSADADPLASDPILADGITAGYVSSGGYGFRIDSPLALGYLRADIDLSAELSVEVLGRACSAQLVERAFYDPDNARLKS